MSLPPLPPGAKLDELPALPPGAHLDELPPLPTGATMDKSANWQENVVPTTTFNGKKSVKREDGAVWYGKDQGNSGKEGWFNDKGDRVGDEPGKTLPLNFFGGVNAGLKNAGDNIMQFLSQASMGHMDNARPGNPIDTINAEVAGRRAARQEQLDQSGAGAKIGAFIGEQAPTAIAAAAGAPAGAGAGFMARTAATALPMAGATYVNSPGTPVERTAAAANVGLMAAPGQAVGEGLGLGLRKLIDITKGKLPAAAQAIEDLGKKWNVRTTSADLVEDPASKIKALGKIQTDAPLGGLGPNNTAQQAEAQTASKELLRQLKVRMSKQGYTNFAELKAAAEAGNPRAVQLMKIADEAGNDPTRVMSAEGNISLFVNQGKVNQAFDAARAMENGSTSQLAAMNAAVDEEIAKAESVGLANQNKPLIDYLKKVKKDINPSDVAEGASGAETVPSRYIVNLRTGASSAAPTTLDGVDALAPPHTAIIEKGPDGWKILDHNSTFKAPDIESAMPRISAGMDEVTKAAAPAPEAPEAPSQFSPTYSGMADYRKGIQNKRQDMFRPGSELTGSDATASLKRLQSTMEGEMQTHAAANNPAQAVADRAARDLHKELVVPFKDRKTIQMLTTETPDVIAHRLRSMTPDQVQEIVKTLGPKGQQAAALNMVDDAVTKAMDRSRPDAYQFRPVEFAKEIQRQQESLGVVLKGEDKWAVDGFSKLMHHLQLAGEISSPSLTFSMRWLSEPSTVTKWMLTTPAGKRLLLGAADLKPGSPAMGRIITQLGAQAPAKSNEE